jgi:hypothetical protein
MRSAKQTFHFSLLASGNFLTNHSAAESWRAPLMRFAKQLFFNLVI